MSPSIHVEWDVDNLILRIVFLETISVIDVYYYFYIYFYQILWDLLLISQKRSQNITYERWIKVLKKREGKISLKTAKKYLFFLTSFILWSLVVVVFSS